jgi:integrase/recombinase XerD
MCSASGRGGIDALLVVAFGAGQVCPELHIIATLSVSDQPGEEQLMTVHDPLTIDGVLVAFDEHLRRLRGVCPEVRRNYARFVRAFLDAVFADGAVDLARISVADIVGFVSAATVRYHPPTVQLVATSLRSFFRFLCAEGLRDDRMEEAVPMVPRRRLTSLPRHLDATQFARLIASLDSSSPRGLRDRAMLLCLARLGLRASEVARLRLDDIDWRNGTVHVRTRKTGHGAVLPLPGEVGQALAAYLRRGRPATQTREVFVLHHMRVGAPISRHVVGDAVSRALRHAGMYAPTRGANLLRHSLATGLLGHGATLKEIADLFGHRSLATTGIYAKVDLAALREVALPWPEVAS